MQFGLGVVLGLLAAAAVVYAVLHIQMKLRRPGPLTAPCGTYSQVGAGGLPAPPRPIPTSVGRLKYRPRTRDVDYEFSIEKTPNGNYQAFIESQPPYNGRDEGSWPTHRFHDGRRHYVCWTKPLKTAEAAWRVAAKWADGTEAYILTGKKF